MARITWLFRDLVSTRWLCVKSQANLITVIALFKVADRPISSLLQLGVGILFTHGTVSTDFEDRS